MANLRCDVIILVNIESLHRCRRSCWRSLAGTNPYLGSVGEISREPELKVEVTVRAERVDETNPAIKRAHPCEEPVINAIPLWRTSF